MELKEFVIQSEYNKFRMLRDILILITIVVIMISSCGRHKQEKHKADPDCVYVCSGHSAKRYHSVRDCRGLSNCSGEILEMTIGEAESDGKTPCLMCVKQ